MLYLGDVMPKNKSIGKEKIFKAAIEIVQNEGIENLNARKLAQQLTCSTQPIYSEFKNMDELKSLLKVEAENTYRDCVEYYRESKKYSSYLSVGMGYIKFAKEYKGLFNYLYMQPQTNKELFFEDINADDIQLVLTNVYHLTDKQGTEYHLEMAIYTYGLACSLNLGLVNINEDEVAKRLTNQFNALMSLFKTEDK